MVGLIAAVLAVPIIPFVIFGAPLENRISAWVEADHSPLALGAMVVAVLAVDVVLPVPSSLVSTLAGARLGILPATACSWLGMTLGAALAFAVARRWGRPAAERLSSPEWLARISKPADQYGSWLLIVTRGLPIVAEATVLGLGLMGLTWTRFLLATSLSNLGIAAAYAIFGRYARAANALPAALVASVLVPLVATWLFRQQLFRANSAPDPEG